MDLDASVVSRSDLFRAPRLKEWWYVGWVDPTRSVYMSCHVVRLPPVDNVVFTVFDPAAGAPVVRARKLWLSAPTARDRTDLRHGGPGARGVSYAGSFESGYRLRLSDRGGEVDVAIQPTAPAFTKQEDQFAHHYSMVSTMHAHVSGTVTVGGRTHVVEDGLGYADHCFGDVPRRTGWHWLAVQNEAHAFVCLLNYGSHGQRYSQFLHTRADGTKEWIRLSQEGSFEHAPRRSERTWRLTAWDVDLRIEVLQTSRTRERLPPGLPFWVDLTHDESFVRASGRVRTESGWTSLGDAYGVLEEHKGVW